ncbi:DUF4262 domain-containing protein [Microbacterium sp. P5_E9]
MPRHIDMRTRAWLDQEDRRTVEIIRQHRVFIQSVLGGPAARPPFAYTVGLFGVGHPEMLLVGLCHHESGPILNAIADRVMSGYDFSPNEPVTLDGLGTPLRGGGDPEPRRDRVRGESVLPATR